MTAIAVFIFGLILGSFLGMVFHRLEIDEAVRAKPGKRDSRAKRAPRHSLRDAVFGRSRCDHCQKPIAWYDNIPLLSFLLLRGRCRHCGKQISHYHPVLELTAALFLTAAFLFYGFSWQFAVAGIFGLVMLLLFAYDLKHQLIPGIIVVPAIALALAVLVYQFVSFREGDSAQLLLWSGDPMSYLFGGLAVGGFFFLLAAVSKGTWIGGGDIKLGFLIGLLLGWPFAVVALILAYLLGTVYAVILLATRRADLKSSVAFGPMLVMGFFIAAFYADQIVNWYQDLVIP